MNQQKLHNTLVLLSGGADSTAALWHVLSNSDEYGKVHVHHVHIHNVEGRHKVEAQAVKAILEYMHEHAPTPFTSSESVMAIPAIGRHFLFDTEVISFITGYMTSRDPSITKVVIGATGSDFGRTTTDRAVTRGKAIHNAFHESVDDHSGAVKVYPLKDMTKQEVYDTLPPDLARLTWSCRTPKSVGDAFIECGRCKTCRLELHRLDRRARKT